MRKIRVYTDGSCSGNPGCGGWAAIFVFDDDECKILKGHSTETTNNRMELTAVVRALEKITSRKNTFNPRRTRFEINSDSAYVVNAICKGWLQNWDDCGWKSSKGEWVKNRDLWRQTHALLTKARDMKIRIVFKKVKGHSGNPLNDLADKIAVMETEKAKAAKGGEPWQS